MSGSNELEKALKIIAALPATPRTSLMPNNRSGDEAYRELKISSDKLLIAALALLPRGGMEDGPGALALPGLLAALRSAADDLAAVKSDHEVVRKEAVYAKPDFSSDAFNKQTEKEISRSGLIGPRGRV